MVILNYNLKVQFSILAGNDGTLEQRHLTHNQGAAAKMAAHCSGCVRVCVCVCESMVCAVLLLLMCMH